MPALTASTVPMPRVTAPWRLSARTLAALAERPPARQVVRSTWDEFAELERAGNHPDVLATLRAILVEHQVLTRTGRCRGCRRCARRSWRLWARSFPCEVWFTVHLGLQGLFTRSPETGPAGAQKAAGRHAARTSL
jgi:hypothetical protein